MATSVFPTTSVTTAQSSPTARVSSTSVAGSESSTQRTANVPDFWMYAARTQILCRLPRQRSSTSQSVEGETEPELGPEFKDSPKESLSSENGLTCAPCCTKPLPGTENRPMFTGVEAPSLRPE